MSKRRVREKKANKEWSPLDEQHYYKANAKYLLGYQLERFEFWTEVERYARKSLKFKKAFEARDRHSNMHAFAWQWHVKNQRSAS